MIIQNALVYQDDFSFAPKDICISNGFFTSEVSASSCRDTIINARGLLALPGLIDLHFHGCMGHDFCDGSQKSLAAIASYQARNGITTIVPATMTLGEDTLSRVCRTAAVFRANQTLANVWETGADLAGINMEGPFLSLEQKGAQNPRYLCAPDISMFERLQTASGGLIRLVDIAPESEGAMDFIDALHQNIRISLAHTTANYDIAKKAYDHGACHTTHLFNAMPQFMHRFPGVIGAAYDSPHVYVELICDGVHLHPSTVRITFQIFGDDRIVLISDSMRATGLSDGTYTLGDQEVFVHGSKATLADGTIAGSVTNLTDCLRTAVNEMGIPLSSAIKCASANPAKALGIYDQCGSITPGKVANLILMDQKLNTQAVLLHGKFINESNKIIGEKHFEK